MTSYHPIRDAIVGWLHDVGYECTFEGRLIRVVHNRSRGRYWCVALILDDDHILIGQNNRVRDKATYRGSLGFVAGVLKPYSSVELANPDMFEILKDELNFRFMTRWQRIKAAFYGRKQLATVSFVDSLLRLQIRLFD